jgi:TonB family protein
MSWWHYLLLVNFYLVLFFGFYVLLLRRETFFQLNRIYLVAASLLSFFIPLIQSDWVKNLFITQQVQQTIYSPVMAYNITFAPTQDVLTIGEVLNVLYISVTLFLVLRLLWQLIILKKAIEKPEPSAAYSFFKKISLGKDLADNDLIAAHEQVHAKQWHSVDVMIIETVMIINWFNPVVYLYRFAIKFIHEFIADRNVVQAGTDKADYALLLLSQTFEVQTHNLATPFYNHSLLKERILMLQKSRSQRIALAKYGLSAPLFILMLIFSSATVSNSKAVKVINKKAETVFAKPAAETISVISNAEIPPQPSIAIDEPTLANTGDGMDEVNTDTVKNVKIIPEAQQPSFPGGQDKFAEFLSKTVKYPAEDKANKTEGRVIVQFVVGRDGTVSQVKALSEIGGSTKAMQAEAERVMNLSPKWNPAREALDKPVSVMYHIPLNFTLNQSNATALTSQPAGSVSDKTFAAVEVMPTFPGGLDKFYEFISKNIRYPEKMKAKNIQGKAFIEFIIEEDGVLSNFKIIREPGYGAGEEAVRVLSLSPKWNPGIQNGQAVRVKYTVPIMFSLGNTPVPANSPSSVSGYGFTTSPVQPGLQSSGLAFGLRGKRPVAQGRPVYLTLKDTDPLNRAQGHLTDSVRKYGNNGNASTIDIRNMSFANEPVNQALYIIDGVEKSRADFDKMDPNTIESFSILKDPAARVYYGEKAHNGVIIVMSKEYKKKLEPKPKN